MSETNGHNGNGNGNGNGRKLGGGRKLGSTEIATLSNRNRAVEMFLAGKVVSVIAEELNIAERTVYGLTQAARTQLIAEKKQHFNERLALLLDGYFDQIECLGQRLTDPQFLQVAEPERLDVMYRGLGILSDKCFVLLAAGRGGFAQSLEPEAQPPARPTERGDDAERTD